MTRGWDFDQRPLPGNVRIASWREVRKADFDLAILHFDENVLAHQNTNGVLGPEWGAAFRQFMERLALPKVAICHGTPQFRGQYDPTYSRPDLLQVIEESRVELVAFLGDTPVVCNSHQARRDGVSRLALIWHGFDPGEFRPPATSAASCHRSVIWSCRVPTTAATSSTARCSPISLRSSHPRSSVWPNRHRRIAETSSPCRSSATTSMRCAPTRCISTRRSVTDAPGAGRADDVRGRDRERDESRR